MSTAEEQKFTMSTSGAKCTPYRVIWIIILCMVLFQFIAINSFKVNIIYWNDLTIPIQDGEFEQLNRSLFCPLISEYDINTYTEPLKFIDNLQFNRSEHRKYFIGRYLERGGLFWLTSTHTLFHNIAIILNRTLLMLSESEQKNKNYDWLPKNNGADIPILCGNRTGRNCVFKPISPYTQQEINNLIHKYDDTADIYWMDRGECRKLADTMDNIREFEIMTRNYTIIAMRPRVSASCKFFNNQQNEFTNYMLTNMSPQKYWNISYYEFIALLFSYWLRIHDNIHSMINKQVNDILFNRYKWISSANTISLPIRGSDKCAQNRENKEFIPEMKCVKIDGLEWLLNEILNKSRYFEYSNINTIIITSEDELKINETKHLFKHFNLELIYNDHDIKQGTGNPNHIRNSSDLHGFNMILSMLTSLKLQMHSNYYIIQKKSNWLHGIWLMGNNFDCQINENKCKHNCHQDQCLNIEYIKVEQKSCYRAQITKHRSM